MPASARAIVRDPDADTTARIAALMTGWSLEAARLDAAATAMLAGAMPAGGRVYLTAVPMRPLASLVAPVRALRAAGLEPVPHLPVRSIASLTALEDIVSSLALAGAQRLLVIAGDRERAAGPFADALDAIESGVLERHGITEVGIAGYPEGHPRISQESLERSLKAKVAAADKAGLGLSIVTQFGFDAAALIRWLTWLRGEGVPHPVRVGMAGPTNVATLMRYARQCGVTASLQGLTRNAGLLKRLVGARAPDGIIRPLAEAYANAGLEGVTPHFFSFGGVAETARWAAAAAAGQIALDRAGGFAVEPH